VCAFITVRFDLGTHTLALGSIAYNLAKRKIMAQGKRQRRGEIVMKRLIFQNYLIPIAVSQTLVFEICITADKTSPTELVVWAASRVRGTPANLLSSSAILSDSPDEIVRKP